MFLKSRIAKGFREIFIKSEKEKNTPGRALKPLPIIIFLFCVWIFLKIILEFPYSSTDVFIFKDPGANLIFKHGFFAENLPYTSGEKIVHFMQGYLYSLLYGLYTLVVGFGFRKAIFFDSMIDLLRFIFTYVYLTYLIYAIKKIRTVLPFFLLLPIFFTFFDSDRSDILATCLALANFILIAKTERNYKKNLILTALLTSLCLFTAPAIGFFTLLISWLFLWSISRRLKICFTYLSIFAICSLLQIGIYFLFFSKSLILLMDCYKRWYRSGGGNVTSFLWHYWRFSFNATSISRIIHIFLWIQIGITLIAYKSSRRLSTQSDNLRLTNIFFMGTLTCILLSYLFFPWQYNYLIFLSYLLIIYSIIIFTLLPKIKARMLLLMLLFLNFLLPAGISAKVFIEALLRPKSQSSHFVAQKIYNIVPFGEKIATIPTYYYILKKHYDPADMNYLSKDTLLSYPYILTGGCGIGKPGVAYIPFQYGSERALLNDFEVIFDSLNRSATYVFNLRITRSGYGFGGLLLKRKDY